jgi:hypothetical protein
MGEWAEVLFTYDEIEAEIVKDILESEDIEVVMESLKIRPYPLSIGRLGEVRLLVKDDDLEKAKAVLRIMKDSTEMEPDNDR